MTKDVRKFRTTAGRIPFLVVWILAFSWVGSSEAAPHNGDIFSLRQPDGTRVDVRVYGDEFYRRIESLDGFTLVRDMESGWICYAAAADDGEDFASTGVIYPGVPLGEWGDSRQKDKISKLKKHLKLKKSAIKKKAEARRAELMAGDEGGVGVQVEVQAEPAPLVGSILGLTILIDFPDVPGAISQAEIDNYCNQVGYDGYGNSGSVRDYFWDVSNRNLEYTNYVTGYYTAKNNKSYYDDCAGGRTRELLSEALTWLDGQRFDFRILTLDSSNRIEALNFFYAGGPDCGWSDGLWPHKGTYTGFTSNTGVRSRDYQITGIGSQLRLGTFCHENGHMICGWPDLYDYGYESRGVGAYCLMASSGGRNPRPPNPFLRDLKGWETIIDITADTPGTLRMHQANSFTTYRYSHPTNPREFFLVESRLKNGRHAGIPDEGLLIWHIDQDGSNNREQMTPEQHYRVSVEQADGLFHLERDINGGGSGDLFHAGYKDTFDDNTLPDARWWDGAESGMRISNISAVSSDMTFVVDNIPVLLSVSPGAVQRIQGLSGGPFGPSAFSFTVTNLSGSAIDWTASAAAPWVSAPAGGRLASAGSIVVDAELTAAALSLAPGVYSDVILFADLTNGVVLEREVELVVGSKELVSCWRLDEISGTIVNDSTGHGHAGTLLGGASFDANPAAGRFGRAVSLDGVDDTIFFEGFTLPKPFFTIALWFNPNTDMSASSSRDDLLYWDNGNHPHMTFNRKKRGEIGLYVEYADVEYQDIITATRSWAAGTWHHIAFTFDTTDYKVYVNGELENTYRHPGIHIDTSDPYFGSKNSDNNFFEGRMDDIRFYNTALPAEAIHALYRGGCAENPTPQDGSSGARPYTALRWLAGSDAASHDVYLGSDSAATANATPDSPEHKGRVGDDFLGDLVFDEDAEYFWRVDEVTSTGDVIGGYVWSFVTGVAGAYEEIYEAEDAFLSGPEALSRYAGYTGSGYADYINASGDYVEWSIFAHYTGMHRIKFRYALGSSNRPLEIRVNSEVVTGGLAFPGTGSWGTWSYTAELAVTLNAGHNTLRATATGSKGANVDHLKVIEDYDYAPPSTGLQVYFDFDALARGGVYDGSGNARSASFHGDPTWQFSGGAFGGAVYFDGAGDYLQTVDYDGVTGTQSRTVSAWIKTNTRAWAEVVGWGVDGGGRRWSLVTEQATGGFGIYVNGGYAYGRTEVVDDNWHHIAAVLADDGTPNVSEVRLYLDGRLENIGSVDSQQIDTANGQNLVIGGFDGGPDRDFRGLIDEVTVFDLALTEKQIARLCHVGGQSFVGPCGRILLDKEYDMQGDVNKDCRVNGLDFVLLAQRWLEGGLSFLGDIDEDSNVGWLDMSLLAGNWMERTDWHRPAFPALNPDPPDQAMGIGMHPVLSWQAGDGAVSHNVYFGSSNPPQFQGNQTGTTFQAITPAFGATFYWRIDEVGPYGTTRGALWSFTTRTGGGR